MPKNLQLETETNPQETIIHQKLDEKFEQFSSSRKSKIPNFHDLDVEQKKEIIEQLENDLNEDYLGKLLGDKVRHCSSETKEFCWNWFVNEANIAVKEEAFSQYDYRIAFEESLSWIFESYPLEIRKKFLNFYESRFDQKEDILKQISKESKILAEQNSEDEKAKNAFLGQLQIALFERKISVEFYNSCRQSWLSANNHSEKSALYTAQLLQEIADEKERKQQKTNEIIESENAILEQNDSDLMTLQAILDLQEKILNLLRKIESLPIQPVLTIQKSTKMLEEPINQLDLPTKTIQEPAIITLNSEQLGSLLRADQQLEKLAEHSASNSQSSITNQFGQKVTQENWLSGIQRNRTQKSLAWRKKLHDRVRTKGVSIQESQLIELANKHQKRKAA